VLRTSDADIVLAVITLSFAGSPGALPAVDREPRAALFVLKYLECTATDTGLKERVASTRKNILDHYAQYVKAGNQ
jgi:hypothetical protein